MGLGIYRKNRTRNIAIVKYFNKTLKCHNVLILKIAIVKSQ